MTDPNLQDQAKPERLRIAPGFFSENTDRNAEGRWKTGDRVRFKNGLPEKVGGWLSANLTGAARHGVPRSMHEWVSHDGETWIAIGTSEKLYLLNRNELYDITPVRKTTSPMANDPFAVVDTETLVTVTDNSHGAQAGDFVRFSGATAGGGITIDGEYKIVEILTANTYTINHSAPATSTDATTGGNAVVARYDINIGAVSNTTSTGYGTGPYGGGTYGTPREESAGDIFVALRVWSLKNFGEDLIASPTGGAIYHWDKTNGATTRAVVLADAPETNRYVLLSASGGRIICLGAYDPVAAANDPLNIIVGAEESLDEFEVIDESSDVYTERMSQGSTLVGGLLTRGGVLIWTDTTVAMLVPDPTEIYRLVDISSENPFVGPNAAVDVNGITYGMARSKFMKWDGVYSELPCDVWGYVFDNTNEETPGINTAQLAKVVAWHNEKFSEVWWFYPPRGEEENARAVVYNINEKFWFHLTLSRTAAMKVGPTYRLPLAMDADATLYGHEQGMTDNGAAMNEFIESFDMQLGEGENLLHFSKFVPDMKRLVGTMLLVLRTKKRPEDPTYEEKSYTFGPTDVVLDIRAKGRQVAVQFSTSEVLSNWRMGTPTLYAQPDAQR